LANTELLELSLDAAASGIRTKAFSALDYSEAFIARCEEAADLNALVSQDHDALRDAARAIDRKGSFDGALAGIPLVLKDSINTTVLPTTGGTGALKGFVAKADASVAASLFAAGALLGGKGNMHELAFGITNNNAVTGAARNPYDPSTIPGGSSGGVAAAVAARMMPAGIGTDTGASVRLPAALCNLVGFRPTVGRYPGAGIIPISHTRDTAGPITRSVADAALLDTIMAADATPMPTMTVKGLRIGLPRGYFYRDLDAEVAKIADETIAALRDAGAVFVEADIENLDALNAAVGFPVALYEFMRDLPAYLRASGLDLTMADILGGIGSPDVRGIVESQLGDKAMPEAAYLQALNFDRPRLQKAFAEYFLSNRVDAILFPTAPLPARPIGEDETVKLNGRQVPTFATYIHNTDPASNAGIPGISIPAGLTTSGLPVGMELDGPGGSDRRLLGIGRAVEAAIGFKAMPPAIPATKS